MARCFRRRRGADERGAEAVEFALVVLPFLLLVFGVIDFGYMINHDTMVNNASREGAREGSLNPVYSAINTRVRAELASVEPVLTSTKITVAVSCRTPSGSTTCDLNNHVTDAISGGTVIVKVDYQHSWITPVGSTVHPGVMTLSKTTEMRIE